MAYPNRPEAHLISQSTHPKSVDCRIQVWQIMYNDTVCAGTLTVKGDIKYCLQKVLEKLNQEEKND